MDDHPQQSFTEWEEWVKSGVTLVEFESPWCRPCIDQIPIIEKLARQFAGEIKVIDLNIDDNRQFAVQLRITSIPTLVIFKNGKELRRFIGLQRADILSRAIEEVLG